MGWFKVALKLKSATLTPWQADTIFGHLCWVVLYRDGEDGLKHFLEPFIDEKPPFLISDGFPPGFLPKPLTFRLPAGDSIEEFQANRELRKQNLFKEAYFSRAIEGEVFKPEDGADLGRTLYVRAMLKNQIDRLTGTTGAEGSLYGVVEQWMPEVVIYGKAAAEYQGFVRGLFESLKLFGYGKRKSTGYGAIEKVDFSSFDGFPSPQSANGFVSLSSFMPSPDDPTKGFYKLRVKYGRLGEEFALGENPFKRPLVMLEAGSAFYDTPVKAYYGRMVRGLSSTHPEVAHYGYALPVAAKIP